jgi:4,5-DOPA dioxygenase extradiol
MLPTLFVSHGSPMIALETKGDYARDLGNFGGENRPRRAVVVVSAHWQTPDRRVTASPRLVYDFGGFPDELYRIEYPCKGDDALAEEIARKIGAKKEDRGLDHGTWIPLRFLFPEAAVPVVQVSLPRVGRAELLRLGDELRSLEDVLLVGSGGVVHNLHLLHWEDERAPVDRWARAFDDWVWEHLGPDLDGARGPHFDLAVPTSEHLDPLYVVLGEKDRLVHEGFRHGNLSMRTFSMRV